MADMLRIDIEVAYAKPEEQVILALKLPEGSSVEQAIKASGVLTRFPEIDLSGSNRVGIFGNVCGMDRILNQADRIEIYRPLLIDPKDARRRRAARG